MRTILHVKMPEHVICLRERVLCKGKAAGSGVGLEAAEGRGLTKRDGRIHHEQGGEEHQHQAEHALHRSEL